jgi:hypothetical protein
MRRWRRLLIGIVLLALMWQGWRWYAFWRNSVRVTFSDGSPAAFAEVSIWVEGASMPMNHQGGGWFGIGTAPNADKDGVYRLSRDQGNSDIGLSISATAWMDGRENAAWVKLESAKEASWPVRLTLNPTR